MMTVSTPTLLAASGQVVRAAALAGIHRRLAAPDAVPGRRSRASIARTRPSTAIYVPRLEDVDVVALSLGIAAATAKPHE
jgi:hypothetical protein